LWLIGEAVFSDRRNLLICSPFLYFDIMGQKVPLLFILKNIKRYSVPKEWQGIFFVSSLSLQQDTLFTRSIKKFSYVTACSLEELFLARRLREVQTMVEDYWGLFPSNVSVELVGNRVRINITIDGEVVTYFRSTECELGLLQIFKDLRIEDGLLRHPRRVFGSFVFKKIETSVGTTVLWSQLEKEDVVEFFCDTENDNKYKLSLYKGLIDHKRFYECSDQHVRYAICALDVPNIVAPSKLDPQYYQMMMNEYEFKHGSSHDLIVANLITKISGKIIVPGDGLGRWAKVWAGEGVFTDPFKGESSHLRVEKKTIRETLTEHKESLNNTIILMYCSIFFEEEDWQILRYMLGRGNRVLYIDTRKREEHDFLFSS